MNVQELLYHIGIQLQAAQQKKEQVACKQTSLSQTMQHPSQQMPIPIKPHKRPK